MTLSADPSIYTDFTGLAALRRKARDSGGRDPETLRAVAGQFEALFVNMMLKSMREAKLGEGLLDSQQTEFYQGMFDQQIALEMSKGRGLGLADMLVRQLGGETPPPPPRPARPASVPVTPHSSPLTPHSPTRAEETKAPATAQAWQPETPEAFVRDLWPHAERAARRIQADPAVLLAQAALETGWGRSMMTRADGRPAYNLFGIKADGRWDGDTVGARTLEFCGGAMRQEQARFRAYGSPGESFEDYVAFLEASPRYREALAAAGDPARFTAGLQRAGYATDPDYAAKIMAIYNSDTYRQAVSAAQRTRLAAANP